MGDDSAGMMIGIVIGVAAAIYGVIVSIKSMRLAREIRRSDLERRGEQDARELRGHQRAKRRTAVASATIVEVHGVRSGGDDGEPVVRFRLRVSFSDGAGDYDVEATKQVHVVDVLRLQVGAVAPVRYDPADKHDIAVDFEGSAGVWISPER